MAKMINCPYCHKLTDPQLENCPHCGGSVRSLMQKKAGRPQQRGARDRQTCPSCQAVVQEGDIICVACGTNLLTGQKIGGEVPSPLGLANFIPYAVGGVIVVVLLAGVVGFGTYLSTRDPLSQANRMIEQQRFLEAQDVLSAYVEGDPTKAEVYFLLGRLQWRNNQLSAAAKSFESAVKLDSSNADAALWSVAALGSEGGNETRFRQVSMLERVVTAEPENFEAWYLLALARGATGDLDGQIDALGRVAELRPTNDSARWCLGVALALKGEYDGAEDALSSVARGGRAEAVIAARGFVASMRGGEADAIGRLKEAAESADSPVRWETLTQLGKLLLEEGRFAEAEGYLEVAAGLRRGRDISRYLYALSLKAQGSARQSLSEFEGLSRGQGDLARDAAVQAANVFLMLDNPQRAREAIERAGSLGGGTAPYYTVLGMVLVGDGNDAEAQNAFKRAIAKDERYAPAYLERGLLYVRREALTEGLEDLERYLALLGPDSQGGRSQEIRALTEQLEQTTGRARNLQAREGAGLKEVAS